MRYRVNLLDTWIDKIDLAGAVAQIDTFVQRRTPRQVVTVNVDFLRLADEQAAFRSLINSADLSVPDGMPLLWGARLLGDPLIERVTGVELISECARLAAEKDYKIFLLGAGAGVAEQAAVVLRGRYPGVRIIGTYAPPMGPLSADENEKMVRLVQEMQPDMLFVAFGAPRQDEWIRQNMGRLDVPVCMGVGGSFDFLAGRTRRAPLWMQRCGLEWLYRVVQEPGRLWKRYLVDDLPIFMQLMAQRQTGTTAGGAVTALLEGQHARAYEFESLAAADAMTMSGADIHVA